MPKILHKLANKIGWAKATAALQKGGYLKKGTAKLTKKGRAKSARS